MAAQSQVLTPSMKERLAVHSLQPATPVSSTAKKIKLPKSAGIEQAFQTIVFNCMDQILANQDSLASQYEVESLHQLRVGLRRLSTAFSLFKGWIAVPDDLRSELKWFSRQLNPVRDWDVFVTSILPAALSKMDRDETDPALLQQAWKMARSHQQTAFSLIAAERFLFFTLNLSLWLHGRGWRDASPLKQSSRLRNPANKFAFRRIRHLQKALGRKAGEVDFKNAAALHKTRINIKNVRYTMEFFHSLIASKVKKTYLREITSLQTLMGQHNDAVMAEQLLLELSDEQALLEKHIDAVIGEIRQSDKLSMKAMRQCWKKSRLIRNH